MNGIYSNSCVTKKKDFLKYYSNNFYEYLIGLFYAFFIFKKYIYLLYKPISASCRCTALTPKSPSHLLKTSWNEKSFLFYCCPIACPVQLTLTALMSSCQNTDGQLWENVNYFFSKHRPSGTCTWYHPGILKLCGIRTFRTSPCSSSKTVQQYICVSMRRCSGLLYISWFEIPFSWTLYFWRKLWYYN